MSDNKNVPEIFMKIHSIEQLTEDKISIDVEIISVDENGCLEGQPIELTMNEKTHQLATMANGKLRAELIFPIRPGTRQHLFAKIHGQEKINTTVEIVPSGYEEALKEKIREEVQKEKKIDDSQLNELLTELTAIIMGGLKKFERKNRDNMAEFYSNLITKNRFKHVPHGKQSIKEISEEIFNLHKDLKCKAMNFLSSPSSLDIGHVIMSAFFNSTEHLMRTGASHPNEYKRKLDSLPAYITDPHYRYPLKSTNIKHDSRNSQVGLINNILEQIINNQHQLGLLEKEINKHIPPRCDFNKKIAEVIRASSDNEIPQEIEKILRSYADESILQAYSFLNACNFRSIGEVVTFEQDRYKILSKDVNGLFERVERISGYLTQQNYTLAWVTFEQLLKSIRSDKEIADVIGINQFESEFDDSIQKLRSQFEVK